MNEPIPDDEKVRQYAEHMNKWDVVLAEQWGAALGAVLSSVIDCTTCNAARNKSGLYANLVAAQKDLIEKETALVQNSDQDERSTDVLESWYGFRMLLIAHLGYSQQCAKHSVGWATGYVDKLSLRCLGFRNNLAGYRLKVIEIKVYVCDCIVDQDYDHAKQIYDSFVPQLAMDMTLALMTEIVYTPLPTPHEGPR